MDSGEEIRRGRYRTKARVPRQTLYSRKKKLLRGNPSSTEVTESLCSISTLINTNQSEGFYESAGEEALLDMDTTVYAPGPLQDQTETNDIITTNQKIFASKAGSSLYQGSAISVEDSHLLLSTYMCCHHLTRQACEDLLELLQIHLPQNNQISSSLHTFQKQVSYQDDIELVPCYHYYCSQCYNLLPSCDTAQCPNPSRTMTMHEKSKSFFITLSVANQLKILLSRKYNHALGIEILFPL